MYQTGHAAAAFSVHPEGWPRNPFFVSNYFRGGTDAAIEQAVRAVLRAQGQDRKK